MGILKVSDFYLYKWRYSLGLLLLISALLSVLAVAGFYAPGGISDIEMDSASKSIHTPIAVMNGSAAEYVLHLPYHSTQKLSIMLFGVNSFAIKLPSLVFATLSIGLLFGVVRLWFRRNVAIIIAVIAATSGQFLLSAQLGTPSIMYIFWTIAVLFSTSMLAHSKKYRPFWLVVSSIVAGLSLYSPLAVLLISALALVAVVHPHARFIIFSQAKVLLAVCAALFGLILVPLILNVVDQPRILLDLTGASSFVPPSFSSLVQTITPFVAFYSPEAGTTLQPVYGLATALLTLIGAVRLFTTKYTAKSYIISLMFGFLIIGTLLGIIPPAYTFIPVILLVGFGVNYLIASWYGLFPLNPYARVAGLISLTILMTGVSFTELERYVYSYRFNPEAVSQFNSDLALLDKEVHKNISARVTILTDERHTQFYIDYATRLQHKDKVTVTNKPKDAVSRSSSEIIVALTPYQSNMIAPSDIAVSARSNEAARVYVYKNGYR